MGVLRIMIDGRGGTSSSLMAELSGPPPPELASTTDLLRRAQLGDAEALNALLVRLQDLLRRWARGRLPAWTRDLRDTEDLVQETLVQTIRNIGEFAPQHEGALLSYLRQAVLNRIKDEMRRVGRQPMVIGLGPQVADRAGSPLDDAIGRESVERFEAALARLRPEDREMVIARIEFQQSYPQIAAAFGKSGADAARMAVSRALVRLAEEMDREG